jgi:hypothetical protein
MESRQPEHSLDSMESKLRNVLLKYDELGAYEFPSSFNYFELEERTTRVATQLHLDGTRITCEGAAYNQDASFSIAILLHDFQKETPRGLATPSIRFSNFGNLTSLTWSDQIPKEALAKLIQILESHDFTFLPEQDLQKPYDGIMNDRKTFCSWWVRYFDWL